MIAIAITVGILLIIGALSVLVVIGGGMCSHRVDTDNKDKKE